MTRYQFKTKPYAHQMQALRFLISTGYGGGLLMEPRTGKTKTAIDYLSILAEAGKIDRAVIVCPNRVLDVWVEQFHMHCPVMHRVIMYDSKARRRGQPPPPVNGPYQLTVLLVNYDAFAVPGAKLQSGRRSKSSGRFKLRSNIIKWTEGKPTACVLDESHKIKSPSGKASNMIVSMGKGFKYKLILTGTPITKAKRMFDIYMQWEFLNPERFAHIATTAEEFKNHFGRWKKQDGYALFLRGKNLDELSELIHKDAYSVKREDCFDLPAATHNVQLIPLQPRSAAIYDELAEEMVAEIEHMDASAFVEAGIALTLTLRLSQITGGFAGTTEGETVAVGTEKIDAFEELLDEAIENDEKIVVCARFRSDLDAVISLCARKAVPCLPVRGGLKRHEVTANIAAFKDVEGVAVCAMNPAAGGLGIDLSTASHMVWYSLTPSWVDFTQACDRIALSPTATTYTYLLAEKTVDQLLYDTLINDGEIGKAILDDPRKVLRNV